jgi:DNA modification methylase
MNKNIKEIMEKVEKLKVAGRHPLYSNVMYWSKKPPEYINMLVSQFTKKNDIIMDPFVGSGSTAIEALKQERKVIGIDINEWPLEIVRNLGKAIDFNQLDCEFNDFLKTIKNELNIFYEVKCNKCANCNAKIQKIVFDGSLNNISNGKIYYYCDDCKSAFCRELNTEDMIQLNTLKNDDFVGGNLIQNSRTAVHKGLKVSDLFSPRNLTVCSEIVKILNSKNYLNKSTLFFLFGSILHLAKITDIKSQSQFPFWIPKKQLLERNIIMLLEKKYKLFKKSFKYRPYYFNEAENFYNLKNEKDNILLIQKPIQEISEQFIPDESVDLIITDPPYFDQVPYSEYMLFWSHWLKNKVNLKKEIVMSDGKNREKSRSSYLKELKIAFKVISRKLKKNKYLCLFFHETKLQNWELILEIMFDCGFSFEHILHLPKKRASYKNITNPLRSLSGDALLLFRKKRNKKLSTNRDASLQEIEKELKQKIFDNFILNKKPVSTSELYDNVLLPHLIKNNYLKFYSSKNNDLIKIIEKVCIFKGDICKWILRTQ